MSYDKSSRFPFERASKIGHIKIIKDAKIQKLMDAFEQTDDPPDEDLLENDQVAKVDLSASNNIDKVIAIDGSHSIIPNDIKNHKKIAFVVSSALLLKTSDMDEFSRDPVIDPRDLAKMLDKSVISASWALPLSGVTIHGQSQHEVIRELINQALVEHDLYDTLNFLVSREWNPRYQMIEHMGCDFCGMEFDLPRSKKSFKCPHCGGVHNLSDYLRVDYSNIEGFVREATASDLRTVLETLMLMRFFKDYRNQPRVFETTLFVKDGPLLLHAQLSRLVDPIRAFLKHLKEEKGYSIHLVGVEKSGDLVNHIPLISERIVSPGDSFIPSVKYVHERMKGIPFDPGHYENKVQYGSKVVTRLGPDHVVAFNVPTGDFLHSPTLADLYGFEGSASALSGMLSYSYENALVPLVLVNNLSSLSMGPSGRILEAFSSRLIQ